MVTETIYQRYLKIIKVKDIIHSQPVKLRKSPLGWELCQRGRDNC